MIINITQHCTLRCPHCMQNAGPERNEMMSKDVFSQALRFAQSIGSRVLMISGGEPTSHPLFFDFLAMALNSGFLTVSVLSNGTFLQDYNFVEKFANMVKNKSGFFLTDFIIQRFVCQL